MFAGGDQHPGRHLLAKFPVAPVVVGDQRLLQPLQPVFVGGGGQPDGVVKIQRHPAVPHQPKILANLLPHRGELIKIRPQTRRPLMRAMMQGKLAADEAHLLRQIGTGAGGVEDQLVADRTAEQVVDRLLPQPTQQVIQSKINCADHIEHQPFATVEQRRGEHLVPDLLNIGNRSALQEPREVTLHDPGSGLARRRHAEPHSAVVGLDLDDKRAQHVETEAAAALLIARITRHRRRNVVIDPVVALLVVIVSPAPGADGECPHLGNLRGSHAEA